LTAVAQKRSALFCQTLPIPTKARAKEWLELLPTGPLLFVVEVGSILSTLQMNVLNIFPKTIGNKTLDCDQKNLNIFCDGDGKNRAYSNIF
jgi:hypothetical protein